MLNLSSGGGSGNYIRFSPQANAWTNQDGEIQLGKVVFDIDNVQTGWLELGVGVRDWQPDAALGKKGPQPTANHKRGFSIVFYPRHWELSSGPATALAPTWAWSSFTSSAVNSVLQTLTSSR